jgi:hypothetical protein
MNHAIYSLSRIPGALFVRLARREKRPVGRDWPGHATDRIEDVAEWVDAGANVGLLLGPSSGLVDVEFDSPEGLEALQAHGIAGIHTPTWRSERGEHRLFRWSPELPATGWRKAGGLEVRIGGNPAQSVLPPSIHPSGSRYRWVIPPTDCAPAELPRSLLEEVGA